MSPAQIARLAEAMVLRYGRPGGVGGQNLVLIPYRSRIAQTRVRATKTMHWPWFLKPNWCQPRFLHSSLLVGTRGSGVTAIPGSAGGDRGGLLGDSTPPGPTSYWEMRRCRRW